MRWALAHPRQWVWRRAGGRADSYTAACQDSYLNPHPVPPRTIAARRIAPAMEPIMILVPLGPADGRWEEEEEEEEEEEGGKKKNTTQIHTSEDSYRLYLNERERERERHMG